VSKVLIYCVNDGAVMKAWSQVQGVPEGSIVQLVADTRSEVTKSLDVVLDHPGVMGVLGNPRCKRFAMIVDDGVVRTINIAASEDDPAGDARPECSMVDQVLQDLQQKN